MDEWEIESVYCRNCAEKIVGYRNKAGLLKVQCPKCGLCFVSKRISRRHEKIDVIIPDYLFKLR